MLFAARLHPRQRACELDAAQTAALSAVPGAVFGGCNDGWLRASSTRDGEPRFASCVALEPTRVAILGREAMTALFDAQPALGNRVLLRLAQLLSERLRQASAKLVSYVEAGRQG